MPADVSETVNQDELLNAIRRMNVPEKCSKPLKHSMITLDSELKIWKENRPRGNKKRELDKDAHYHHTSS